MVAQTKKARIQVYADPQIKRRIELAAAKYDVPVTDYCLEAIVQRLADDELLDAEAITIRVNPYAANDLAPMLRALHDEILEYRHGAPIDVDAIINDMRDERDEELTDLH